MIIPLALWFKMSLRLAAVAALTADSVSIGDRLTVEVEYLQTYKSLPLSADEAAAQGWQVEDTCLDGFGRRAESGDFGGELHIWYDLAGAVMGYGGSTPRGLGKYIFATPPWRRVNSKYEIDFLFRDPSSACGNGAAAVAGSIGDRLLMVVDGAEPLSIPLNQPEALSSGFKDGGPCWTDMGYHMVHPLGGVKRFLSPAVPMYSGDGSHLTGVNLPATVAVFSQRTPPFEHFASGQGGPVPVYGFHVFFIDNVGVCGDFPTLAPFDLKAHVANSSMMV